jgi:hypothetical protein
MLEKITDFTLKALITISVGSLIVFALLGIIGLAVQSLM